MFDTLDLSLPSLNALKRVYVVGAHANHEHVCTLVLSLTIDTEMSITTGIVNLNLDLPLLYILDTLVDIQHGGLVFIGETILEVVANEAGLTYGCITNKNDFYFLLLYRINDIWLALRFGYFGCSLLRLGKHLLYSLLTGQVFSTMRVSWIHWSFLLIRRL